MKAVQSGNIFVVGECLNNNYNPFLENSLNQTARDFAVAFNNPEEGLNIVQVIDSAIEQYKQQLSP
jgi:hypothetical protein